MSWVQQIADCFDGALFLCGLLTICYTDSTQMGSKVLYKAAFHLSAAPLLMMFPTKELLS